MENNAGWDPGTCLIDVYADWREKSAAVDDAYWQWSSAPELDRALAFAAYKAALDREECASIVYENHLRANAKRRRGIPVSGSISHHRPTKSSACPFNICLHRFR